MADPTDIRYSKTNRNDLDTPTIVLIGFLSAILLFVLIIGMQVLYYTFQEAEINAKVISQKPAELTRTLLEQQEKLNAYRWVNEASGTVAIPIHAAMDRVVKDHR